MKKLIFFSAVFFFTLHFTAAGNELYQNLGKGDLIIITNDQQSFPEVLIQSSSKRPLYGDDLLDIGFHIRTGEEIDFPTDIRMHNLNTCHVIGVHGEGTVARYTGRWEANGGNALPHLVLTEGGHFVFTAESSMNGVLDGSFFVRQLWVYGDGSGVLELDEGFIADHTVNEPLPDALGTIRLGGATLITHHTRNMPSNTRSDGRGGLYQNGHVVFERVNGSRWIVDSHNQVYGAQIDFAKDGTIETRAALTHTGHRRICLPVGPGGHFISSGAFRTTAPDVTITKTGSAMLALEGEQSYYPGSRLVAENGLLRMATDPGLGRDEGAGGKAGPFLTLLLKNDARLHLTAPMQRMQRLSAADKTQVWLDKDCFIATSEGIIVEAGARFDLFGSVSGALTVDGVLALDPQRGEAAAERVRLAGIINIAQVKAAQDKPLLKVEEEAVIAETLLIDFSGTPPERILLVAAGRLTLGDKEFAARKQCMKERYGYRIIKDGNRLIIDDIQELL